MLQNCWVHLQYCAHHKMTCKAWSTLEFSLGNGQARLKRLLPRSHPVQKLSCKLSLKLQFHMLLKHPHPAKKKKRQFLKHLSVFPSNHLRSWFFTHFMYLYKLKNSPNDMLAFTMKHTSYEKEEPEFTSLPKCFQCKNVILQFIREHGIFLSRHGTPFYTIQLFKRRTSSDCILS